MADEFALGLLFPFLFVIASEITGHILNIYR